MQAFYAGHFVLPLPAGHPFPMVKYQRLRDRVVRELPHDPVYIQAVTDGSLGVAAMREIGFPWSVEMVERSRRSAGATVAAERAALGLAARPEGVAANMAGGPCLAEECRWPLGCRFGVAALGCDWQNRRP